MDIEILCNTPDEVLFANIANNAKSCVDWVCEEEAHEGHAVIVGGGPSLAENLEQIRKRYRMGQAVFALNGAAKFLNENGIVPDYQVILDARSETAGLVSKAQEYLLASQCHPSTLAAVDPLRVSIWHPVIEGIEDVLSFSDQEYVLIGGGLTVGLSSMCLAYAMGYRKIHLFGYDSSHRIDLTHAYSQPMNSTEPRCKVTVNGKAFSTSLTMARQAEAFPDVCNNLIDLGCIITVDSDGLIAEVVRHMAANPVPKTEEQKYKAMWSHPEYRFVSPGENIAQTFVEAAEVTSTDSVVDFGCGTGRGGQAVANLTGAKVLLVDFAANALDDDIKLPFVQADLTKPMTVTGSVGYCTDVLEHIPTEDVPKVIENIMACVPSCFFQVSLVDDAMGVLIGQPLHLTVKPVQWWLEQFAGYDVVSSGSNADTACFYVHRRS